MTPGEADADGEEARGLAVVGRADAAAAAAGPVFSAPSVARRAALVVGGLDAERQLDPPHPLEDPLRHHPLPGEQVADHAEREELHGGDEEDGAEDQRLDVPAASRR